MFISAMRIQTQELSIDGQRFLKRKIHEDINKLQKFRDDLQDDQDIKQWDRQYDFEEENHAAFGSDTDSFDSEVSDGVLAVLIDEGIIDGS